MHQNIKLQHGTERKKKGWLRHICVRYGYKTGEAILTLVAINEKLSKSQDFASEVMKRHPELVGVCLNINTGTTNVIYGPITKILKGRDYIFEKVNEIKYKVSATSFFQINTVQAERMLKIINEFICRDAPTGRLNNTILDAYCGSGFIALALAKNAKKVIGIEEIKPAIEDARFSARENKINNVSFIHGKVENKISEVLEREKPEIIILDPPQIGRAHV